jgi:hypothetical protein
MHRILHYVVIANRLRATVSAEVLVQKVAVNWNKRVDAPPALVAVKEEVEKISTPPLTSSPSR